MRCGVLRCESLSSSFRVCTSSAPPPTVLGCRGRGTDCLAVLASLGRALNSLHDVPLRQTRPSQSLMRALRAAQSRCAPQPCTSRSAGGEADEVLAAACIGKEVRCATGSMARELFAVEVVSVDLLELVRAHTGDGDVVVHHQRNQSFAVDQDDLGGDDVDVLQRLASPITRWATCAGLRNGMACGRVLSTHQSLTWAQLFERNIVKRVQRPAARREYRRGVGMPTPAPGARRVMGLARCKPDTLPAFRRR